MKPINESVALELDQCGILHLKLNRPLQLNALNHDMLQCLSQIFHEAKHEPLVKAILLTGEGKAFCAGADIKQLLSLNGISGLAFAQFGQHVFNQLELLGKPSLAAIQGFAFGGGCELAMAATLRIAANNTMFGQPEIKLGLIPGFGGTQRLARLIGKGRALNICLTAKRFNAEEALQWGFVNELVSPDHLLTCAKEQLMTLLHMAPVALQSILMTIHQGYDLSLNEGLAFEAAHFGLCCTTEDKQEGVRAFLEKREAVFSGA
jgi:enoyl-CoA hydratase